MDEEREAIITANRENRKGVMSNTMYDEVMSEHENKIAMLEDERTRLVDRCASIDTAKNRIAQMNAALEKVTESDEFDEGLFKQMVETIKIYKDHSCEINLKCGITIQEHIA